MVRKCDDIQFIGFQRLLVGGLIDAVIQDHFTLLHINIDNRRQNMTVAVIKIAGCQGITVHHRSQYGKDPNL